MVNKNLLFKTLTAVVLLGSALGAMAITPMARMATISQNRVESTDENRYETILFEDFSKWSAGTSEAPDETMYPLDYFTTYENALPSEMFSNAGDYNGLGLYQAGGCVALNYPGMGGYLNFPSIQMNGKLILTARVKALGEKNTNFSINILTGDLDNPQSVQNDGGMGGMMTIKSEDGWVDINREIVNPYSAPCWLQINAMMYNETGIVVDYVKIERDLSYLSAPSLTGANHFTNDGFSAYWNADPRAESYLVSLYRKTPIYNHDNQAFENFENASLDPMTGEIALSQGWTGSFGFSLDGNIATEAENPDDIFEGKQAIRLHNNDRLSLFLDNNLIKDMSMAFLAKVTDKENCTADLRVIPYTKYNPTDSDYPFYWMLMPSKLDEGWNRVVLSELFDDFYGGYTRVDLIPEGLKDGEYMIIDNLCGVTEPLCVTDCIIEDQPTDEPSYTFTGLNMGSTYYFTVKSKNSTCVSESSEQTYAVGVGAPTVKEATEIDKRGAFTANWTPAVNATSYTLNWYESQTISQDLKDYVVFSEDFSKAEGGEEGKFTFLNNMDYVELDSFADNVGWGGSGTIVGDGMVGCYMMEVYNQLLPFEMLSPVMDLSRNDGNFKVNIDFMVQNDGETLVIQCDNTSYIGIQGQQAGKMAHASVDLTGGTSNSKLMIYALGSTPFMLDKIEVTQDYKAGEEILTKIDSSEIENGADSSARISGLERKDGVTYVYDLVSHRDHYGVILNSEPSEKMHVDIFDTGMESIEISDCGKYQIFDLQGRQITSNPEPGIYIVLKDGKAYKTIVK